MQPPAKALADDVKSWVLDTVAEGVLLLDAEGRIVFANPAASRAFGQPPHDMVGHRVQEWLLSDSVASFSEALQKSLAGAPADSVARLRSEARKGRITVHLTPAPPSVAAGLVLARAREVTETDTLARRLEDVESRYRSLIDLNMDAFFAIDLEGRVTEANRPTEELTGRSRKQLLGSAFHPMVEPDELEETVRHVACVFEGKPRRFRTRVLRPDGSRCQVSVLAIPMRIDGETIGAFGIARDITQESTLHERREAARERLEMSVRARTKELAAANTELEAFSYSVSHDLRAPLRGIDFFAQILEEDHAGSMDPEARALLGRIRGECQRMTTLIRDLLALSKASRERIVRHPVDLSALAHSVVDVQRRAEPARDVEVQVESNIVADGDPHMLRVVMENLIGNAWKYTSKREQARIGVAVRETSEGRVFCVHDNGIGLDANAASALFRPFQRLANAREFEGTGIGLATVARIIARHGGRIWAEGRAGKGATFCFTLGETSDTNVVE